MSENTLLRQDKKPDLLTLQSLLIPAWMKSLWDWADKNNVEEEVLPRDKQELLKLKELKLFSIFHYFKPIDPEKYSEEERMELAKIYIDEMFNAAHTIDPNAYIPNEIGKLTYLEELCISMNPIERLPDNIVYLQNLKKLCLCNNINLILTNDQKLWIWELEKNGTDISYDDDLMDRCQWVEWE